MTETLIPLDGTYNLRDIGGYSNNTGRSVARGRVYRSDNLNTLSDQDLDKLSALGITAVFDFRGDREVELQPSRLWSSVESHVRLPISDTEVQEKSFIEKVTSGELTEVTVSDVGESYISILENHGQQFRPVLEAVAAGTVVLYHCTAGKDRTGLATALLHGLCGVARQDIILDFGLSNRYRLPHRVAALKPRFAALGIDIEPLIPALAAPEQAMALALDHLDNNYHGIDGYLTSRLGVDTSTVESIREALLD